MRPAVGGALVVWIVTTILIAAKSAPEAEKQCQYAVRIAGLSHTDYPANNPIEDRHVVKEGETLQVTVFDGHGGFEMAEHAKKALPPLIEEELSRLPKDADDNLVGEALKRAFEATDQGWVDYFWGLVKKDKRTAESRATMGACALSAVVRQSKVFVANAGDCRAILGRRRKNGAWRGLPLSFDHNAREPREQRALKRAHPDEHDLVVFMGNGVAYVKGRLQPTRSLGDLHLKLPELGPQAARATGQWTAPYIRGTPEVSATDLDPKDRFLVLGSDGLWDNFNNSEVADLVGHALDRNETAAGLASMLVEKALERCAESFGVSVEQIRGLKLGTRRNVHDDITVIVVLLEVAGNGDGCAALEAQADDSEDEEYGVFADGRDDEGEQQEQHDEL